MKRKYIMEDVAREAGVSITTVSHVINKTRYVEKETEMKVLEAIKKFNYIVSLNASSMRGKRTKLVGLIIPDVSNPVFARLSRDLENVFFRGGYSVTLCNSEGSLEREISYLDVLKSRSVDGIIIVPTSNSRDHLENVINEGTVLIAIEREIKGLEVDNVIVNGFLGFYEATKYLISLGHKKIGFIKRPYDLSHSIMRFKGYYKALKESNIEFKREYCPRSTSFAYRGGYSAMEKIIGLENKPTAILTFDDIAGIGAMKAIQDSGLLVPDDFSVIGFDNILIDNFLSTTLSSITFPTKNIASETARIFFSRIKGSKVKNKKIVLKPVLKIRGSVSKPKYTE